MNWISLILSVVNGLGKLVAFLNQRQLINAGEAKALTEGLKEANVRVQEARDARRNITDGSVPDDDPYLRD